MVDMHLTDPKTYNEIGDALAAELSAQFPDDLVLEREKVMKGIFIKAKFYLAYVYDNEGNFQLTDPDDPDSLPFLYTRGVILARRDYPPYAQKVYERTARNLLDEKSVYDIMNELIRFIQAMLRGEVNYNDLVMVKSISAHYKQQTYFMAMFAARLAKMGKPVKPGERIGYLVHKPRSPEEEKYMGNRMITPELYEESKYGHSPMEIDYMYYLERQMTSNLDAVFAAGLSKRFNKYGTIKVRRTSRCKYVCLDTPMKFMSSMLRGGCSIDDLGMILTDIKSVDDGKLDSIILREGYDRPRVSEPTPESKVITVDWDALYKEAVKQGHAPSGGNPSGEAHITDVPSVIRFG
jgi:hypothetical protein